MGIDKPNVRFVIHRHCKSMKRIYKSLRAIEMGVRWCFYQENNKVNIYDSNNKDVALKLYFCCNMDMMKNRRISMASLRGETRKY